MDDTGSITTLRPSSTSSGSGWTPSSGTLHGVTSDNSDATYATWGGSGSAMILGTPLDSPPAGEKRHQIRLRLRGEDGDAWGAVRLASGSLAAGASAPFTSSPSTVTGAWGFGAPADGSTILATYVTGQSTGVRIQELYIDVDSRLAPTFTGQTIDGSGTVTTSITDTSQPILRADAVDLDDLAARQYRYWVTLDGAIVWDTGIVSGPSADRQTTALDNGSYVAHYQVWSTIGSNGAYASDEETVSFTLAVGTIPAPDPPVVAQVPDSPIFEIEVCAPDTTGFDEELAFIEIQRVDCPVGGYLWTIREGDGYASTPSGSAPTDLQVTVTAGRDDNWFPAPGTFETLAANWNQDAGERGWHLVLDSAGKLALTWSPDGTATIGAAATERVRPDPFGVVRVRVLLDTDDGAGGWTVTYQDRESEGGTWTQLGDVVTNSGGGTTSIFDSPEAYTIGAYIHTAAVVEQFAGRFYEAEIRDGAAGAVLASPDFTGRMAGTNSFTDDQANTWTVHAPAQITSDQRITSVVIIGPMEADECATYLDFSLPRTGVGQTCEHQPDQCCSYYRARTLALVDGLLQVSSWTDDPTLFCLTWPEEEHLIRSRGPDGPVWVSIGGILSWDRDRPFTSSTGVMGGRYVTSAPPGGRNLKLATAVESEAQLATLRAVLNLPLALVSPADADEGWAAPVATSVRVIKVGRIRQVATEFIGTGPQPPPQLADLEV